LEQSLTPDISRVTRRRSRSRSSARRLVTTADTSNERLTVQEAVAILESAAIALAAPRFTADDIAEVRSLNRQMATELEGHDYERAVATANEFHEVFHRKCPNQHLLALLRQESCALAAGGPLRSACSHDSVFEHHERLVDLIEIGAEPRTIERHVRAHCGTGDLCMVHLRTVIG
jgi:DNA-binding GntR family transcriptional regulator